MAMKKSSKFFEDLKKSMEILDKKSAKKIKGGIVGADDWVIS